MSHPHMQGSCYKRYYDYDHLALKVNRQRAGGRKSEVRGRKSEVGGETSGGGGRRTEVGSRRAEGGGRGTEMKGRMAKSNTEARSM